MGRKEVASGLVGGMIAFVAYVWQAETAAFFDSFVPNAGYYAVRIVFAIAALYALAVAVHWARGYVRKRRERKEEKKRPRLYIGEGELKKGRDYRVVGQVAVPSESVIERMYGTARLEFKIESTTDWFEVGLRDSRQLTISKSPIPTKGKMYPLKQNQDLAGAFFRIDHTGSPELEVAVKTIFETPNSSVQYVFLRKGNDGDLRVEVLDEQGTKLGEHTYSRGQGAKNQVEFAIEYDVRLSR